MTQSKLKCATWAAVSLTIAGTVAVVVGQSIKPAGAPDAPAKSKAAALTTAAKSEAASASATATATVNTKAATPASNNFKVLVFRNKPSWNRSPDFEDVLADLAVDFAVEPSSAMATHELSEYRAIVIPGAQQRTDYYQTFNDQAERFEKYVTNGGVLVLELNGAEGDGVQLPGGVTIASHGSRDNTILYPDHPALTLFGGRRIRANFASHCYLENVPTNAVVLVAETLDDKADTTRPTFIEYAYGSGRVIAACQCFHDRDGSGRGVLMPTLLTYATGRKWYTPKK